MHDRVGRGDRNATETIATPLRVDRPVVVELNGQLSVSEALALLQKNPDAVYAEPDYVGEGGAAPNDPNYSLEWHHQKIHSEAAWSVSTGSSDVLVAILDSGLNANQTEFDGRVTLGYDYANDDSDPSDDLGHGTLVAGVLAANANNNWLVAGMNWRCRLLIEKVLDAANFGYYSWWAQAIYDATDAGAKVINLSAGGGTESIALTDAIDYAISHNVIFITITHNDGSGAIRFPGRLPQSITVGGTERNDVRANFSNYGAAIDLVAPARDIYTVDSRGALAREFGTSHAAPLVSGVAAIVASLKPRIAQREMEQLICASAQDRVGDGTDMPGWDLFYGYGRLNAKYAVQIAKQQTPLPEPLNISTRGFVSTGDAVMIAGFILTGAHAKNILIRALGPSLTAKGVAGALQDPTLELYDSAGQSIVSNGDWRDMQEGDISAAGLAPTDNREAAIMRILQPGAYTAIVRGLAGLTGVGLVEAYNLQPTPNSKLANISTRGFVGLNDDVLIGGFIVGATSNYVIRALGPSLRSAGLSNPLEDPVLQLHDANGALTASNDNWTSDGQSSRVQTLGLAPKDGKESAMYVDLSSGPHTAIVRGKDGSAGIGLVEIYNVP